VIAWRRLEQIPPEPTPWLLACARHVLAHARRSEHRRAALIARLAATPPRTEVPAELSDGVPGAGAGEPAQRDREVLLLVAWEGLSTQQAATVLDCSPRASSMRLHRARKRLSAALEVVGGPTPRCGSQLAQPAGDGPSGIPTGGWQPSITDTRGPFTVLVLKSSRASATCLSGPSLTSTAATPGGMACR
jgi:hypothetical protein